MIPLTPELIVRIEACEIAFWVEKLAALQAMPGNPYEVDIQTFGGATALFAQQARKNTLFNRVCGLTQSDLPYLDAIVQWHRQHAILPRFDLVPTLATTDVLAYLTQRGFAQSGFYSALYGAPTPRGDLPPHLHIREVRPDEADLFAEIYRAGFGMPQTDATNYLRDGVRLLIGHPAMHCLLAWVDDTPAAMAILYHFEQTGYLATAATLPQFRQRGCQTALINERMALAWEAGCQLIVGHTSVLSASQRNMEHAGLRLAYTKALWTTIGDGAAR